MMKRKACPRLVQSETNPSCTIPGQSWTKTYYLECLGGLCAAYRAGECIMFDCNSVDIEEAEAALEVQKGGGENDT